MILLGQPFLIHTAVPVLLAKNAMSLELFYSISESFWEAHSPEFCPLGKIGLGSHQFSAGIEEPVDNAQHAGWHQSE